MTAYLRIRNMDLYGNTAYANLQIGINQGMDGKPIGWFEIIGDNGTADGGTWEWMRDEHHFVRMKLFSNKFKTIIGQLGLDEWGKGGIPPPQPYFWLTSKGSFVYLFPGYNHKLYSDCWVTRII